MPDNIQPSTEDIAKVQDHKKRVTVLFSGRGSNMASLISASMAADYPAIITNAITNVPEAGGLEITKQHKINATVLDHKSYESRQAHEEAVASLLKEQRPDIIALAGYMRILSPEFVKQFTGKIINIHPSLLPAFKGVDTHHRALTAGVRIHGCTVHFVDETLDGGPIIAQGSVPVFPNDDEKVLANRVLTVEHIIYPQALAMVANGTVRNSAGRTVFALDNLSNESEILISPDLSGQEGS